MGATIRNCCMALALAAGMLAGSPLAAADDEGRANLPPSTTFTENGTTSCTKCHDDEHASAMQSGPHWMAGDARTPSANKGCESCHGPGGEHAKQEKKFRVAQTFEGHDPDQSAARNAVCLTCHGKSAQRHFQISEHSRADVACSDCHAVHAREDLVRDRLSQAEVCVDCHTEQKANMNKFSRHPVREGKVVCTDCHNPHGSKGEHQLVESTVNEVCYHCHTEKRGPFLFEHEPVQDSCTNCHNPHGSINDSMLIARRPFLCQQCHIESRHPGTIYTIAGVTDPDSVSTRIVGKACADCHTQIHGTNHPGGMTFRR